MRSKKFIEAVNQEKAGGIKNEAGAEFLFKCKIPLPPLEVQNEIVEKIEKQRQIIEGAELLNAVRETDFDVFKNYELRHIEYFAELNPKKEISIDENDKVSFVPMEAVDDMSGEITNPQERQLKEVNRGYTYFRNGDVLFAKITPCMENGKAAVANNLVNDIGFGSTEFHVIRVDENKALAKYIHYIVRTKKFRELAKEKMTGASGHKRVPEEFLATFKWPLPPLETQRQIVEKLDRQMQALEGTAA